MTAAAERKLETEEEFPGVARGHSPPLIETGAGSPAGTARGLPPAARPPARPFLFLVLALGAFSFFPPLRADVLVLDNGNEIQGEILAEGEKEIVVRFPGGILRLDRRRVRSIRRQSRKTYLNEEAEKAVRRGSFDLAVELYEEALKEDPRSERARKGLFAARLAKAERLRDLKRYREALALLRRLEKEKPGNAEVQAEIEVILEAQSQVAAEEARAEEEIRRGDLETAVWRLERIHRDFPDRREAVAARLAEALAALGDRAFGEARWTEAGRFYERAMEAYPARVDRVRDRFVRARFEEAKALLEASRFAEAEASARSVLEVAPGNRWAGYLLALALEAGGRDREALELYGELVREPPPQRSLQALRRRLEEELALESDRRAAMEAELRARSAVLPGGFRKLRTAHFVVRHRNALIAREVAAAAEEAYRRLFRELGCSTHWRRPCEITVFPRRRDYLEASGLAEWSGGAHRLAKRLGPLSEHKIYTFQDQPRLTAGMIQHEVAHALLLHRLNYPERIPLWANEGFAMRAEPDYVHRHYRRLVLIEKSRRALIDLERLFELETYPQSDEVELFYGQSLLLVDYLIARRGTGAFVRFLKDLTLPKADTAPALEKHYGFPSVLALQNGWLASLGR